MNKCILIGNLTRDPELTTTATGVSLYRFSIAVNRAYANQNGEREADFFNIVTWRGLAENCSKYLSKGRKVAVVGNIQNRSYEDKDGNKRYSTDIVAEDVEFLTAMSGAESEKPVSKKVEMSPVESDDLPF